MAFRTGSGPDQPIGPSFALVAGVRSHPCDPSQPPTAAKLPADPRRPLRTRAPHPDIPLFVLIDEYDNFANTLWLHVR